MIIRASRDMEAGTEITFWYHSPSGLTPKNSHEKHKHWGFVCGCAICLDARATDNFVLIKRRKLIEDLYQIFSQSAPRRVEIDKIERLLDTLNQTYTQPAEDVPRLLLWEPQLALTCIYAAENKVGKTMESAVKVLTSLGYVVVGADSTQTRFEIIRWGLLVDHLVETLLHVRSALLAMGAWEDSGRAEEYARTTYKILVGEDASFDATYV